MEGKTVRIQKITSIQIIAPRKEKTEQFVVGTISALITRLWVVFVTGCLLHAKREKVYQEVYEAVAAKRKVCLN